MTEITLTDNERTLLILLAAAQLNTVQSHREMARQTEELVSILAKIRPADRQLVVRMPS